jgi:Protein of unknown function (DUF3137)
VSIPYTRGAVDVALIVVMTLSVSVILISVGVFVASRRLAPLTRARQQAIAALCAERALLPGSGAGDFAILGRIDARWLSNCFSSQDHGLTVADFVRPAGKNTQFFTLLSFTVAGVNVPYVAVARRNLIAGPVLGGPPTLELESTEFDKRFMVKAKDRRSAVMLLDPGMMQWLLDCDEVSFDMVGGKVLAFINRAAEPKHQPTEPVEFEMLFKFFDGFVPRVPELLRTEYAARTQKIGDGRC